MRLALPGGQKLQHPGPLGAVEIPDPADERRVQPLRAALGHVGAGAPAPAQDPPEGPEQAEPPGVVQKEHRVAPLQPPGQGAQVVAVHHPGVPRQGRVQPGVELRAGAVDPPGLPPQPVQIDGRQAQRFRQGAGEGGLARAGAADDQHPAHPTSPSGPPGRA